MIKDDIRIGVVGLGAIGPSHIFSINKAPGCKLSAICDIRAEAAEAAAKENGVSCFTSLKEMLKADVVDALSICTPSGYHLTPALEAINAGKHILVEKPLEITLDRVDKIITAAADAGVTLAGIFQSRFNPFVRKLKALIDNNLLGDIYSGSAYIKRYRTQEYYDSGGWRGTWEVDGGGCLMNQGIHLIDLFLWFMGDAGEVIAITETSGRKVEVETLAIALVRFKSGARGVVEGTVLAYPEYEPYMEMIGSRGTVAFSGTKLLYMDLIDPTAEEKDTRDEIFSEQKDREAELAKNKKEVTPGTPVPDIDAGHTPIFIDFAESIHTGREPFINGKTARKAVEFITAIYESGKNNSSPVLL